MNLVKSLLKRGIGVLVNWLAYYFGGFSPYPIGYVFLELTRRCNLKCAMCGIWNSVSDFKMEKDQELDWLYWTKVMNDSKYLQVMPKVRLTGGEPFLREDIGKLISALLSMRHVYQVCVISNGSLTRTILTVVKEIMEKCPRGKILEIAISLDGVGDVHDAIRGVQGVFENVKRTLLGLCELREKYSQLRIISNSTLQPANIDSIEILSSFLKTYHIDRCHTVITNNTFLGNQDSDFMAKGFTEKQLSKVFAIASKDEKLVGTERYLTTGVRPLPCYAGFNSVLISSKGLVYPCSSMAHNRQFLMGDLRESDFDSIWGSYQAWQVRRVTQSCDACWNVCELRAARLQHIFWEWSVKFASFGLLDYYRLRQIASHKVKKG